MTSILKVDEVQNTAGNSILKVDEIQDAAGKKILQNTGSILQVIQNNGGSTLSTTSSNYTDGSPTINITPTSSDSKILFLCSVAAETSGSGTDRGIRIRLLRDSTVLTTATYNLYMSGNSNQRISQVHFSWLDSPATTDQVTYKYQFSVTGSNATSRVNNYGDSALTLIEVSA